MPKIPDCDRCLFYSHNPYIICGVHPDGIDSDRCLDFRPDPNAEIEEQWSPEGYTFYGDELIPLRPSRYTSEEQLEILDNHPFFTGVCPECGHRFDKDNPNVSRSKKGLKPSFIVHMNYKRWLGFKAVIRVKIIKNYIASKTV